MLPSRQINKLAIIPPDPFRNTQRGAIEMPSIGMHLVEYGSIIRRASFFNEEYRGRKCRPTEYLGVPRSMRMNKRSLYAR